jgi:hypothetical protein
MSQIADEMPDPDPALVVVAFGGRGHLDAATLRQMQGAPAMAHARYPKATLLLSVDGYDDDPRSLWDIPEAAAFVRRFAKAAGLRDWRGSLFQALDETSRGLLIACDAIDKPHPFTLNIVPDSRSSK